MKKIGILTFHRALNYGAVLQTYALENTINKLIKNKDIVVEVIDYRCHAIENLRKLKNKLKSFNILKIFVLIYKKILFNEFLKNINISKNMYRKTNVKQLQNQYDKFIFGSDQIWNYKNTNKDYSYLLDFIDESSKKYSYAASIGLTDLKEEKNNYKSLLSSFNKISVRESECKNILEELNVKVDGVHLDPTLLLTGDEWQNLFKIKKNNKKYILVYNIPSPNQIDEISKKISLETGLDITYISVGKKKINIKNRIIIPSIPSFLSSFFNAEYIITNSFHGTVFSIIFKKNFLVELKQDKVGNDRIITLLKFLNLENRIVSSNNYKNIYDNIDWSSVLLKLNKKRDESINFLKTIIYK